MSLQQIHDESVLGLAEYIWLSTDPENGREALRSWTVVVPVNKTDQGWSPHLELLALDEEMFLFPANFTQDPIRGEHCYLVVCEVRAEDGQNHPLNNRAKLRGTLDAGAEDLVPYWSFDQPVGVHIELGGHLHCKTREPFELFLQACLQGGIRLGGGGTERMAGRWSFQIGSSEPDEDLLDRASLHLADQLLFARWIFQRAFEDEPVHRIHFGSPRIGFSTEMMRHPVNGRRVSRAMAETIGAQLSPKTEKLGYGPVQLQLKDPDPYLGMNQILMKASGLDTQHLADEDQERYGRLGLRVIPGGLPEPALPE